MANFCIVNENGGAVSVKFTATNGLRAHVRCGLFDLKTNPPTLLPSCSHSGYTGNHGEITFKLNRPASQLQGIGFAWVNEACLQIPGTERAGFKVEFFQDNEKLKVTGQNLYYGNYTPCTKGTTQQRGQYIFIVVKNNKLESLWVHLS